MPGLAIASCRKRGVRSLGPPAGDAVSDRNVLQSQMEKYNRDLNTFNATLGHILEAPTYPLFEYFPTVYPILEKLCRIYDSPRWRTLEALALEGRETTEYIDDRILTAERLYILGVHRPPSATILGSRLGNKARTGTVLPVCIWVKSVAPKWY